MSTDQATPTVVAGDRPMWKSVVIPSEHGGWGLTAEPILLGLLIASSWAGLAIGVAALLAFLARTPLKLAVIDHRRGRELDRTGLARRVAAAELACIAVLGLAAVVSVGWWWLVPLAVAAPLIGVELWFDIRSRGRRLVPELCGAVAMGAVASAIVVAAGGSARLAVAAWIVLAARALAAIPFIRTQILRLRRGVSSTWTSDVSQALALGTAALAVVVERDVLVGSLAVGVTVLLNLVWVRTSPVPPAKVLGLRQMALGFAVVAATAIGVHLA